jgi:hypothetical protein
MVTVGATTVGSVSVGAIGASAAGGSVSTTGSRVGAVGWCAQAVNKSAMQPSE